ncbi:hypothetical protein K491DRAFT_695501 [Lophiostoma macrostomum CBS 122681]|uniref:FAD/NAD(P)-binding domain-containing protein n=1 Tax=Lophiostoma macrostomum CBS 122681 TaxID=1314788 RepID=A0A6A6SXU2_9PLEO|nr:hypothetical protein K491DRAFT_695501 [Lophiostoma macrostomum CBS 122681]
MPFVSSVLIVGAGPAGLVAAKTLSTRSYRPFKVTIYEQADRVGGMWTAEDKCSRYMRTNLSRFNVAFSDFPWPRDPSTGEEAPMFPQAHQVGAYLEAYAEKFLGKVDVRCGRTVHSADLVEGRWIVESRRTDSGDRFADYYTDTGDGLEEDFDYLVVASGFFSLPSTSDFWRGTPSVDTQHSSRFGLVCDLTDSPGNIVVVGGGISGSEAAASAALQLSTGQHHPGDAKKRAWADRKIYHVFERPFYCLPRYLPQNPLQPDGVNFNPAPNFLPLDLQLYNINRRVDRPIAATSGRMSPAKAKKAHDFIRSLLGGDQEDLGHPELVCYRRMEELPAFTGVSDLYSEFVRSGIIIPVRGRVTGVESFAHGETSIRVTQKGLSATITEDDMTHWCNQRAKAESGTNGTSVLDASRNPPESRTVRERATTLGDAFMTDDAEPFGCDKPPSVRHIADVAGVIEATGFQPHVNYLSEDVRRALGHDPKNKRIPLLLSHGSVFNKNIPELAFIGFYEAPYWGVMEAQANLLASSWDSESPEIYDLYDVKKARDTHRAIEKQDSDIPQSWMGDYVGHMEQISRMAHILHNNLVFTDPTGYVYPARYINSWCDQSGAEQTIQSVIKAVDAAENKAGFVAAAAFRALQGRWNLRRISAQQQLAYEGHTATFHPRIPPHHTRYVAEHLYVEVGMAKRLEDSLSDRHILPVRQQWVFRYDESQDTISLWTVSKEDQKSAADLVGNLEFEKSTAPDRGWKATVSGLLASNLNHDKDHNKFEFEFRFRGSTLAEFSVLREITVIGKHTTARTLTYYARPVDGGSASGVWDM